MVVQLPEKPLTAWFRALRRFSLCRVFGPALVLLLGLDGCSPANPRRETWAFSVAGDSRNCGNLVMPAIAAGARANHSAFYWHLGDLRKTYAIDEDFAAERRYRGAGYAPTMTDYTHLAASDFVEHQVRPFGDMPFFVGIGNHETIAPASRLQFRVTMRELLDRPELRNQRLRDGIPADALRQDALPPTYYHWRIRGVEFVYLDNATDDAFDDDQMQWFGEILRRALADRAVKALVVGMHEALPHSLGDDHSMCASKRGIASGELVYRQLAQARDAGKHVYVLASHSHFYLANVFETPYWQQAGPGVLPGWIIGTAGAERYPLPAGVAPGPDARSRVYGYLQATVSADGTIDFRFQELARGDLASHLSPDLDPEILDVCVDANPPASAPARSRPPVPCD